MNPYPDQLAALREKQRMERQSARPPFSPRQTRLAFGSAS